ncbi:rho guanine nucleotide exchange factor 10-like protein [Trichonephila clavata]|uniref:Rho guanine nucleotide exchange factor 10-like protein n=1 Tax=Trichonephila clavata TaxID=2740835 RepID=A0A8X6GXA5_TRICU|nr:rho guanine nucleotide exchange factor 10-like protein [Trichonephila clavata]
MCARWLVSKEVMMLSNGQEAKHAKVNRTMKDGSKEFECPVAIELYNKIMGGVDLADQRANVYELDRKLCKWWKKVFFRLLGAQWSTHRLRNVNSNIEKLHFLI